MGEAPNPLKFQILGPLLQYSGECPIEKRSDEADIGLVLLITQQFKWKSYRSERPHSSHYPLLLRSDYIRARVESIKRFPSQFTFLPLILDNHLTDLIILQQDSFHLKKISFPGCRKTYTVRFIVTLSWRRKFELLFLLCTLL